MVTRLDDATADTVITELHRRAVPVIRLDPGDFPDAVTVRARVSDGELGGQIRTATRSVDVEAVRSVYWRRPTAYAAPAGVQGQDGQWCVDQARFGLGGVLAALPGAHYINHPWRNRDAEYKPAQLAVAARCGLHVPPTLLTNDAEQARRFTADFGPVVYKPMYNTPYTAPGPEACGLTVWVDAVAPAELDAGVAQTMHLFQQQVAKEADIRLTAVGDRLFAVRIDGSPGLDWRRHYDHLSYTLIDTPPDVAKGVRAYLDHFGLVFGALDFGLDQDGRWWWYECNPSGQFAWFPDPITAQIINALADQLQRPPGIPS